jgi:vacuolar protein sorting-associated protein 13A/C
MIDLRDSVASHYSRRFLAQMHRVLGSIEVIGNPINLFSNVSTGVSDFFYEPYKAMADRPEHLSYGIAKGTTSLIQSSMFGVMSSTSQIGESLTKGNQRAPNDPSIPLLLIIIEWK